MILLSLSFYVTILSQCAVGNRHVLKLRRHSFSQAEICFHNGYSHDTFSFIKIIFEEAHYKLDYTAIPNREV
jgi:hypothetical protein